MEEPEYDKTSVGRKSTDDRFSSVRDRSQGCSFRSVVRKTVEEVKLNGVRMPAVPADHVQADSS